MSDQEKPDQENDKTLIRGQDDTSSQANDDATILRPKDSKPGQSAPERAEPQQEANDDATLLRAPQPEANDDATVIRGSNEPEANDDATIIRSDSDDSGPKIRERRSEPQADSGENATILRGGSDSSSDSATILRGPEASDSATILRSPDSSSENRGGGRRSDSDGDNATLLREPGEDGATILRSRGESNEDATILRSGDDDLGDDDDRTVMNENFDDDATVMGAGGGQDTTYVAKIGNQPRAQGNSEAGRLLKNRFVLEEKIGSGGMGDVYKALDLRQQEAQERDPYIAIKLLNENFARHKDAFLSLQRETSRTRGIPHPNIMAVYDFDREGDTVFMSMELLDGKPLDDFLKEHPEGVSEEDAWNIIDGISEGLMRAHNAGIVHSDFKPGNIFYTRDKTAKVFDFGIARAVSNPNDLEADGEKTVFDAGSLGALTPTYASYEMLKGLEPSKSDDVYAVALVAYELFMGKHPYDRVPADKALERGLTPKPVPFLKRRHWRALKKALALKGEDRTQTMDEFKEGMFSEDPPYARYAAIATVIVGSMSFAAYQALNVKEKPDELVQFENSIAASKVTLETINRAPRWESEVWHEQLSVAMNRLRAANQEILDNEEWVEEWEYVSDPDIQKYSQTILEAYLREIRDKRDEASSYPTDTKEGVQTALEFLKDANIYASFLDAYRGSNPEATRKERERLTRVFDTRTERLAAIELAEQQAEEARLAEEERVRLENERIAFETNRRNVYQNYLDEVDSILRCKGNVANQEINRFGELLALMESEWKEAYDFHYPKLVTYMGTCIQQRIGYVDPARAREVQAMVTSFLPGETGISSLVIEDKDPCAERKLVGRGNRNRSWCIDNLSEGGQGPELVVIPPINSVTDTKYAISRAEIKIGEYNLYCANTGCAQLAGNSSLPATNLSLDQARGYTEWLTSQTGQRYRLPSVREWEHAAIADNLEKAVDENINCTVDSRGVRLGETLLNAISGRANTYGLYNFVGNAREWALDEENTLYAMGGAHTDPRQECTLDKRIVHEGGADPVTGFRIVREIIEKDGNNQNSELASSGGD